MTRPAVIGIAGPARAGKDTLARFIIANIGGYRYSFADPIRAMLKAGFGIDMADPYWQDRKEEAIPAIEKSPRQMMQTLGTEWGRNLVHQDVWLLMALNQLISSGPGMVIPDVRFENEAAWVRKHGVLVHVRRGIAPAVNAHSSETGVVLEAGEAIFYNDGSVEDLNEMVKNWLHV